MEVRTKNEKLFHVVNLFYGANILLFTQETLDNVSIGKVTDQPLGEVALGAVLSSLPRNSSEIRRVKFPFPEGIL